MKKLAIGCAVLLVLGVAGAATASYFAYRKVTSTVAGFAELGSVPELERSIRNQRPFVPPATGDPSPGQIEHLLQVQQAVRARLGSRVDEVYHRYRPIFEPTDSVAVPVGGTVDSAMVLIRFYRDLAGIYVDGKRAQVDALNRADLSLEEYRWTRSQAYAALGMPLMDLDVSRIIEDVKEGRQSAVPAYRKTEGSTGSPALRKIVEPHRKALEANVGLAFFGL